MYSSDSAVAGEAAGIGMGLVMLGSASEKAISEMIAYAHDTSHERIIRVKNLPNTYLIDVGASYWNGTCNVWKTGRS